MADNLVDKVFSRRALVDNTGSTELSSAMSPKDVSLVGKQEQLASALQDKRDSLRKYAAETRQRQLQARESLAGRLMDDPEGFVGSTINQVAGFAATGASIASNLLLAPATLNIASRNTQIPEEEIAAQRRMNEGKATLEDITLLNTPAPENRLWGSDIAASSNPLFASKPQPMADGSTRGDRLTDLQDDSSLLNQVHNTLDISSIVNRRRQSQLSDALKLGAKDEFAQMRKGYDQAFDGTVGGALSGAGNMVSGLAKALPTIIPAVANNKIASLEHVVSNLPQLALAARGPWGMAATNIPYAIDAYRDGVEAHQEANDGSMPSHEWVRDNSLKAASLAAMETLGDKLVLGGLKGANVVKGAIPAAAEGTSRSTFMKAMKAAGDTYPAKIAASIAEGGAGEFVTEAYQTAMEENIKGKTASLEEVFTGGAIGAIAGGLTSGGLRMTREGVMPDFSGKSTTPATQAEQASFKAAVETNDPTVFTDPAAPTYNPAKAVGVLLKHVQSGKATEEVQQTNLEKAHSIVNGLEEQVTATATLLQQAKGTPEQIAELKQNLAIHKQLVADMTPEQAVALGDTFKNLIDDAEQALSLAADPKALKLKEAEFLKLNKYLTEAQGPRDVLAKVVRLKPENLAAEVDFADAAIDPADTAGQAKAQQAIKRVLLFSMTAPQSLPDDAIKRLMENTSNGLSEPQRQYLREFSAARIAQNALKDGDIVQNEILHGDKSKGQMGILDYKAEIGTAIAHKSKVTANRLIEQLNKFAEDHAGKQAAFVDAMKKHFAHPKKATYRIVSDGNRGWSVHEGEFAPGEQAKNGGLNVHGGNTLLEKIEAANTALTATVAQMNAAYALQFGDAPAVQSSQPPAPTPTNSSSILETGKVKERVITEVTPPTAGKTTSSVPTPQADVVNTASKTNTPTEQVQKTDKSVQVAKVSQPKTTPAQAVPKGGIADPVVLAAQSFLKSLDSGGIPLDATKANKILRAFGAEVPTTAKLETTIQRIREAVARAVAEIAQATPTQTATDKIATSKVTLAEQTDLHLEYLRNPPENYTTEKAAAIGAWAKGQIARLTKAIAQTGEDTDEADRLEDLRNGMRWMVTKSKDMVEADGVLEKNLGPQSSVEQIAQESANVEMPEFDPYDEEAPAVTPQPVEKVVAEEGSGLKILETPAAEAQPKDSKLGTKNEKGISLYRTMNRAVAWLTQKKTEVKKDADVAKVRPLVEVRNLLALWTDGQIETESFFTAAALDEDGKLTESEKLSLNTFKVFANEWSVGIKANFIKGSRETKVNDKYVFKDPVQDLFNADGTMDANVITAVAYAAFSWISDTLNSPALLFEEDILKMHGMRDDGENFVTPEGKKALREFSSFEDTAINSLGQRIVDALGLQANKDATQDYLPKLSAALGAHALRTLERANLVTLQAIPGNVLNGYLPTRDAAKPIGKTPSRTTKDGKVIPGRDIYNNFSYVKVIRKGEKHTVIGDAKTIKDSVRGSQAVLDRFFGSEQAPTQASWRPMAFRQLSAKRTDQGISIKQKAVLEEAQTHPLRIIPAMWSAMNVLGEQVILRAAGWREYDTSKIQVGNRDGVEAQNSNLENQLDGMADLVRSAIEGSKKFGINQPFFINNEVWKNFRVGVTTRNLNPQSSKIHRFMFARPEWVATIRLDDQTKVDNFLVAVAQAFGIKTDQQPNGETLSQTGQLNSLLNDKDGHVIKLAEALNKAIQNPESNPLTELQKEDIAEFTASKEGMQTLQALVAYGKYLAAGDLGDSSKSFTVHMLVGVDGKTNGPILTHLALGAAQNATALLKQLNRGGFYSKTDGFRNFNHWFKLPENMDLYESLADVVIKKIAKNAPNLEAFYVITKPLLKGDKITSAGRNLVKTPLTSFAFGSSIDKSLENMQGAFLQAVVDRIEAVVNGDEKNVTLGQLIQSINALMVMGGIQKDLLIAEDSTIEVLMDWEMKFAHEGALKRAFSTIMEEPVTKSMKSYFASFIQRRDAVNKNIQASFGVYLAIYQDLRNKEMNRLMDSGEMSFDEVKGVRIPDHDLTNEQEQALREKVAGVLPTAHTAYSQGETSRDNGLYMAKSTKGTSVDSMDSVSVQMGTRYLNGKGDTNQQVNTKSVRSKELSPGVAGLPYFMHSLDSFIMHMSLLGTQSLNVHDEAANGADKVVGTAKAINGSTWNGMLNFSPATQAYEMLERAVINAMELVKAGELSVESLAAIEAALFQVIPYAQRKGVIKTDIVVTALWYAKQGQLVADRIRLETLAQIDFIDQYTWEGGEYEVTPEDKAQAVKMLAVLPKEYSLEAYEAADALGKLFGKKELPAAVEKPAPALTAEDLNTFPVHAPATITAAAATLAPDAEVSKAVQAVQSGTPLGEALTAITNPAVQADLVQAVTHAAEQFPADKFSAWGEMGTPAEGNVNETMRNALGAKPEMTGSEAIELVKSLLGEGNLDMVQRKMLDKIADAIPDNLTIKYVTKDTLPSGVLGTDQPGAMQRISNDRGWYHQSLAGENVIYIISNEHKRAFIMPEVLLHELYHAAVASVIHDAQTLEAADVVGWTSERKKRLQNAQLLVKELDDLLVAAKKVAGDTFPEALVNVDEMVAWGMSNRDFQEQVLNKVTLTTKAGNNPLVKDSGMKKFIKLIAGLIFGKDANSRTTDGLAVLIGNVSGLFAYAAQDKGTPATPREASYPMASPQNPVHSYTTQGMYDALHSDTNPVSPTFDAYLRGLLGSIVQNLHGPFGSFKEALMKDQPLTPDEVFQKAQATGKAPFASLLLGAGFGISTQTAFVLEQVEATVRAALDGNESETSAIYTTLSKLFDEQAERLTGKDFFTGDWAQATVLEKAEAQRLRDFMFQVDTTGRNGDKQDYLARFAALGLAHEGFNKLLNAPTKAGEKILKDKHPAGILTRLFQRILSWFNGKATNTHEGQMADAKLLALVDQLAGIEAKKKHRLANPGKNIFEPVDNTLKAGAEFAKKKLVEFGTSDFFKKSKSGYLRGAGAAIHLFGAEERVGMMMGAMTKLYDQEVKEKHGFTMSMVSELIGVKAIWEKLLSFAKNNEKIRKHVITQTAKGVMGSFANNGKNISTEGKKAVTNAFLRTGAHVLLDKYDTHQMENMLADKVALATEINSFEGQLTGVSSKIKDYYLNQAKVLAYQLITGRVTDQHLMHNAGNIASLYGTVYKGRLTEAQVQAAEATLDSLISLYAMEYLSHSQKTEALKVLKAENARTDGNGIHMIMVQHKALEKKALETVFASNKVLMQKGYTAEIYNPYIDVKVANDADGEALVLAGYIKGALVELDTADHNKEAKRLYTLLDGGLMPHLSGFTALTDMKHRGTTLHSGSTDFSTKEGLYAIKQQKRMMAEKQAGIAAMFEHRPNFDPRKVTKTYLAPVLNANGESVNYAYLMSNQTKDMVLERNNDFDKVLGAQAGSVYDKESSVVQNRNAVQALKDQHTEDYAENSNAYEYVGPKSTDPENLEIYKLMPTAMKQAIKDIWGEDGMWVRKDTMRIAFGYRKASASSMFEKDYAQRNLAEKVFSQSVEALMYGFAKYKGMSEDEAQAFKKQSAVQVRRGERMWQGAVQAAKDNIVIKTGGVMMSNIADNLSLLWVSGVPLNSIRKYHAVATEKLLEYERNNNELFRLQMQILPGSLAKDIPGMEAKIAKLKDAIARNPIKPLIDAGLMTSIIEDVSEDDDSYGYKSQFNRWVENKTSKLPASMLAAGRTLYMAHDTKMYQSLSQITKMSDFVARYTLYQHLIERKANPLSHEDAIQQAKDSFINYDVPMHKALQYTDDMGITMFTKYFLRIQRVLYKQVRENPGRVLVNVMLSHYLDWLPSVMDASVWHHLGNNPGHLGPLQFAGSVSGLMTAKAGLSLFP